MGKAIELKTTTNLVKVILEDVPDARNDDNILYYHFCEQTNKEILNVSLGNALKTIKLLGIPSYETVGRCRRKLQAKYPHLRASDNVEAGRMLSEEAFREYAKESV